MTTWLGSFFEDDLAVLTINVLTDRWRESADGNAYPVTETYQMDCYLKGSEPPRDGSRPQPSNKPSVYYKGWIKSIKDECGHDLPPLLPPQLAGGAIKAKIMGKIGRFYLYAEPPNFALETYKLRQTVTGDRIAGWFEHEQFQDQPQCDC